MRIHNRLEMNKALGKFVFLAMTVCLLYHESFSSFAHAANSEDSPTINQDDLVHVKYIDFEVQ